jgi:cbb3-type cytochrome oxidase subunit 3
MHWETIMGLVAGVMLLAYLGVVVWAYRKDRRQAYEEASRYPFFDEEGRS